MEVVENLSKKAYGENSFIEKTYGVGTHWNCLYECETTTYVTEMRKKNSRNFTFPSIMSIVLPLLNNPNCQSVLNFMALRPLAGYGLPPPPPPPKEEFCRP